MSKKKELPNLTDDPAYAAAHAKLTELQSQLSAASARRDAVLSALNAQAVRPASALDNVMAKARALLGNATIVPGANVAALRAELAELEEHLAVLRAAVELQRQAVQTLREEVSRRLVGELVPTHRAMVKAIVERIVALDAALSSERDMRDGLFERGISTGALRPMPLLAFGRLSDGNSTAAAYLLECVEHGFLSVADLPANLQSAGRAKLHRDPPPAQTPSKSNDGWLAAA